MTGSLQTKKGRKNYYAVLNTKDVDGKRKPTWVNTDIPVVGNNKRKAEQAMKRIISEFEINENLGIATKVETLFSEFMEQWLNDMKLQVQESTIDSYQYALNHIVPYFKEKRLKLKDLKPEHIQTYFTDKTKDGLGASTLQKHHSNIHKALDAAVRFNMIPYNPADRVQLPKKKEFHSRVYNEDLLKILIECAVGSPIESAVIITAFLGLRRSEVLGLKWSAVDLMKKCLCIQTTVVRTKKIIEKDSAKNKSSFRTLPIPTRLHQYLVSLAKRQEEEKQYFGDCYIDNDWVCKREDGRPITPTVLSHYYAKILSTNKLPHIRFHDLRHSAASLLLNAGCEMYEVMSMLGHSQISTTIDIYGHMDYISKQRTADKMNDILGASNDDVRQTLDMYLPNEK